MQAQEKAEQQNPVTPHQQSFREEKKKHGKTYAWVPVFFSSLARGSQGDMSTNTQ